MTCKSTSIKHYVPIEGIFEILSSSYILSVCISQARSVETGVITALDKRAYLVIIWYNFCQLCTKTYVGTPYLNRLVETGQIRGHKIWF